MAPNCLNLSGIRITDGSRCCRFSSLLLHFRLSGNVTLILFGSAGAREIEKQVQQNARGLDVAIWREDAQSETLKRKFVLTIVGAVQEVYCYGPVGNV